MRLRTLLLVSTALLLAVTCDKKKEEPEPQPQPPVTPKIEIPSESQAVFSQGISIQAGTQAQSQTVKFTATAAWSADVADTKSSSWLSVQPTSGSAGAVTMTVTAQPNTTDKARSSTVTIQCGTVKQSFTVNQDATVPQTIAVESVTLNKTELTLEPDGTETLIATIKPDNATDKTVTWSTSNAEIANVADGKVTAVKEGEAIITAKAGEKQATCKVTVKKATVAVESVTLNKTELTLEPDGTETLIATIKPDNATDKTVTWSTSNAEIANVADGKVTAVKEGEAIITAKAGEKQATCKVTVKKGVVAVTSVTLNKDKLDLKKGEDETLVATVAPDDATDKTVTWSSSDATIASVDQTGKVTAVKSGKATITAAAGEKSATCSVTVTTPVQSVSLDRTSVTLEVGQMTTLFATVSPNDADEKTVTWTSSNVAVASIAGGVVTAMSEGTAVIKASVGGKEASCTVTVQKAVVAVTSVTMNKSTLSLTKDQSETLTATVAPENATDKTVTWSSSDATIASVDQTGKVTAVKSGKATITAAAGEKSVTCEVTITTPVQSVSLDLTTVSLEEGQTTTLMATISPNDADEQTVTWSTSNSATATVANGVVTAVAEGTAVIKASAGGKEASCTVTVKKGVVAVTSVTLNKTTLPLTKGQSETLTATVTPDNATDKTVTWSSSDATIASVDQTGKVTAVKSGKATITAAAGEKSATCEVTVTTPVQSVSLDRTTVSLEEGQTTTLTATISPNDADEQTITWTTSNAAAATVTNGVVTAVAEGTAVIKASVGGKEASCTVTVKKSVVAVTSVTLNKTTLPLTKGQSETLTATVAPDNASDKTVTWSSSDATIASVDQSGKVTAVKSGKATITAAAGEKSATCEVTVTTPVQSVSLDRTSVSLEEGQTTTLTATISPNDADEQTITWSTSNSAAATVSNGVVTAVAEGTAVIKASVGGKEASCTVTVKKSVVAVTSVTLNKTTLPLAKGQSETLIATVNPDNATNKTVFWSSSDATIASVDQTGKVTAMNTGVAIITAKAGDKEATCKITVTTFRQRFVHRSLMMFFTSIHCGYSRSMINHIHKIDAPVRDKYIRVDVHGRGMGDVMAESPINYPEATLLESLYWFATPSAVIDCRRKLYNWTDENEHMLGETLLSAIKEQEQFYPAVTGTSFISSITGNTLSVEGTIHSDERETFKFMVYLLEDAIPDSSFGYDTSYGLKFDNVLRMSLTSTLGDEFTLSGDNSSKSFHYNVIIPDNYNKDNLSILVIVQRKYGNQVILRDSYYGDYYVDNCRRAKVGEEAILERFEDISGGGNEGVDLGEEITF